MSIGTRLIQNTGFIFASGVINKFFSLFFIAYAARILGPGDFGLYALIGTLAFFFFYFGNLGIGPMAIREIARDKTKAEELFNNILSLRVAFVILAYPIIILVVNLLDYRDDVKYLTYIAGLSAIFSTFSNSFGILYVAFERFKVPSLISIMVSFLSTVSNILILYFGYGLKGIIWISFIGSIMGALISGFWVRKRFLRYKLSFNLSIWKDLITQSAPFALISFFQQANSQMNILLLSKLPGPLPGAIAMGYYNLPSSVCRAALLLPASFGQSALPIVASNTDNLKIVKGIINRSTKSLIIWVIFPLLVATTFFPGEIITLVFGKEYLPATTALTILGWGYALQIFNIPVSVTLSASREISRFIPWAILSLCINLILAVPLIYYYSFIGAAIAFLLSKVIGTIFGNYLLQVIWGIRGLEIQKYVKILAPTALAFVIILFAYVNRVRSGSLLILTLTLYLICIYSFKELRQEIVAFSDILKRKTLIKKEMYERE